MNDRGPLAVVVIEDRQEDRFFLGHILREAYPGCQIVEFSYAEDALAYLRSPDRPKLDLIFVDISMPRMDGFEFADAYDNLYAELKSDTRLFVLSSTIDPADHARVSKHSAISGFIEKPPTVGNLVSLFD